MCGVISLPSFVKATAKDGGVLAVTGCDNRCWDVMHNMHDREIFYILQVFGLIFLLFIKVLENPLGCFKAAFPL